MAGPSASSIANALSATNAALRNNPGQVPTSPLIAGYAQWVGGYGVPAGLPRPITEFLTGSFGPLSPIQPMPIDAPTDDGRPLPRRYEYPVGWNLPTGQPGSDGYKLVPFGTMRALADRYSVVRAMLDIRINEMAGLNWDVGATVEAQARTKGDKGAAKDQRERAGQIVAWLKRVDTDYNGFQSWFTACLEDQHVIDALSLHRLPPRVKGKGLFGSDVAHFELLSGDTIRPLLDIRGARPRPPAPAYQQYLWGVPRSDMMSVIAEDDLDEMEDFAEEAGIDLEPVDTYSADQLLYLPRWKRSWSPYGFSSIEKALLPIMIGINRQNFLLDYFVEGSIPGVYVIAGDQYVTPAQQRQLQDSLNALAGDTAWKHRVIVLPPGSKTDPQKDLAWQASVDQTIIEQVSMILHIQPHEVGMVPGGRTSGLGGSGLAQQQGESVTEQRTNPDRKWWKETFFDWVIQRVFRQEDLEFKWLDFEEQEDSASKADTDTKYISIGRMTIDEARIDAGLDPFGFPLTSSPFIFEGGTIQPLDPEVPPPAPAPPQVPIDPTTGQPPAPKPPTGPFAPQGARPANQIGPGKKNGAPGAAGAPAPGGTAGSAPAGVAPGQQPVAAPDDEPKGPPHPSFPFAAGAKPAKGKKPKKGAPGVPAKDADTASADDTASDDTEDAGLDDDELADLANLSDEDLADMVADAVAETPDKKGAETADKGTQPRFVFGHPNPHWGGPKARDEAIRRELHGEAARGRARFGHARPKAVLATFNRKLERAIRAGIIARSKKRYGHTPSAAAVEATYKRWASKWAGALVARARTLLAKEGKPKAKKVTVADLLKWKVRYNDDKLGKIVHQYLLRSYPPEAVEWATDPDGSWSYDPHVPMKDIAMARRPGGRDPKKVDSMAERFDAGASLEPIVIVERADQSQYRYDPADGWHRLLGAEKAGREDMPAFIGRGFEKYAEVILGEMQAGSDSKKKAARAELAVLRRYLRKGSAFPDFRASAIDSDVMRLLATDLSKMERDAALEAARVRIDKAGGNPQGLRDWYTSGADGAIEWGSDGDWYSCVRLAAENMDEDQAKGYCTERHIDATGVAPGQEDK